MLIKLGLWVGTPSLITFLASSYSLVLDNPLFVFVLALGAILLAIVPPLSSTNQ